MEEEKVEKDFVVTNEDEEMVAAKLQEFVIPVREEPKVYQPIIFIPEVPSSKNKNLIVPPKPIKHQKKDNSDYLVLEISSTYYNSRLKKLIDFFFGFATILVMFYFLNYQPLLIFLIYIIGMMQAIWAFKAKRLFIVWGFITGAVFSMFVAFLVYAMV